jgi:hypothetical protein
MKKTWTEQDALDLIAKVETEFMAHLSSVEALAKSEDDSKEESDEDKEKKAKESKEKEESKEDKKEDAFEAKEMEKSEEEEIEGLYKSMTEAEQKMHYSAIKKVLATEVLTKTEEVKPEVKVENKENDLVKSELEAAKAANEELKKTNEELKKNFEGIVTALKTRFVKPVAPKQKAITELGVLNKTEETVPVLSEKEIRSKLTEKAKDPSLTKSDRDLINKYCYNQIKVEAIKHLLK